MLKSCKWCGRIHDTKFDCGKKPTHTKKRTHIVRFRSSGKWQRKRNIIISLDQGLCAMCKKEGQYIYEYLEVHHIVPLSEDWDLRLDEDNIITLCEKHHELADQGKIERQVLKKLIKTRYELV